MSDTTGYDGETDNRRQMQIRQERRTRQPAAKPAKIDVGRASAPAKKHLRIDRVLPLDPEVRVSTLGLRTLEIVLERLPAGQSLVLEISLEADSETRLGICGCPAETDIASQAADLDLAASLLIERTR